jgi:hypothetical protein
MPRSFLERYYDLRRVTHMPAGGHFAPLEEPELLVDDIRAFFREVRSGPAAAPTSPPRSC